MIGAPDIRARYSVLDIVPPGCTSITLDYTGSGAAVTATVMFGETGWVARAANPSAAVGVAVIEWQRGGS